MTANFSRRIFSFSGIVRLWEKLYFPLFNCRFAKRRKYGFFLRFDLKSP